MTHCPDFDERLDDLLDGALSSADTQAVETHVAGCPGCRRDLAERRALARDVARLPQTREPAHDRWPEVRAAIEGARASRTASRRWLAAAAVLAGLGLAGLVGYRVGTARGTSDPLVASREIGEAERAYAEAASAFRAVVDQRLPALTADSRAAIHASLDELDRAIAELRLALDDDPSNVEANRSWNALYRRKIRFLRTVSRLSS